MNVLVSGWVKMGWLMLMEVSVTLSCVVVWVVVVAHCSLPFLVVDGSIIPYWCRYVKAFLIFFFDWYEIFSKGFPHTLDEFFSILLIRFVIHGSIIP